MRVFTGYSLQCLGCFALAKQKVSPPAKMCPRCLCRPAPRLMPSCLSAVFTVVYLLSSPFSDLPLLGTNAPSCHCQEFQPFILITNASGEFTHAKCCGEINKNPMFYTCLCCYVHALTKSLFLGSNGIVAVHPNG